MGLCLSTYIRATVMLSLAVLLDIQLSNSGHTLTGSCNRPDSFIKHMIAGSEMINVGPKCWVLFRELRKSSQ